MNVGSFFSGCGLFDLGLTLAGHEHSWFCEADPFRRDLLAKRWPHARVHNDIRTVGAHNLEPVTGIVGGFPCKGASSAGLRNGLDHPETVLWREMARAVGELRPRYVVVENVADLLSVRDGTVWGEVLGDLAALRFDVVWDCFPAAAFGAPHLRDRVIAIATNADFMAGTPADPRQGGRRPLDQSGAVERSERLHRVPEIAPDAAGRSAGCDPEDTPGGLATITDGGGAAPADAGEGRWEEFSAEHGTEPALLLADAQRRGVAVEWGAYAAAIHRWEAIRGPAPEPLVRRVDDGGTAGMESSRLSALGDGVQVQLGQLVGEFLMAQDNARAAA